MPPVSAGDIPLSEMALKHVEFPERVRVVVLLEGRRVFDGAVAASVKAGVAAVVPSYATAVTTTATIKWTRDKFAMAARLLARAGLAEPTMGAADRPALGGALLE